MVEHAAVNRRVAGSSPARGAYKTLNQFQGFLIFMNYFLYILNSLSADKFYIGIFANPELRLSNSNSFEKGFTSRYRPWKIVFTKMFLPKNEAIATGKKIKSRKSSKMILKVISG